VVSPENSRDRLSALIKGARRQLLIYDPEAGDPAILRLLAERAKAGIDVRIIGKLGGKKAALTAETYPGKRLHVRAIVVDGRRAFLGSQSLRRIELDERREIGVVVTDGSVVKQMQAVFEEDWAQTDPGKRTATAAGQAPEERATSDSRI
jgi:phosphatidylserine/phosphatidylglycerophosphate/cardiolipin synthase-like enzyme